MIDNKEKILDNNKNIIYKNNKIKEIKIKPYLHYRYITNSLLLSTVILISSISHNPQQ